MPRILLLGAGFSRNWGGWLASEVTDNILERLVDRPWLAEMLQVENNFEEVLGQRRDAAKREGLPQQEEDVRRLEDAIRETFAQMNAAFARRINFEFSASVTRSIGRYLARFDAIFTLNPDLLLEFHYADTGLKDFRRHLCAPDTQIMVIGYSFSDPHINAPLLEGAGQGLKMFLVDPAGRDLFKRRPTKAAERLEEVGKIPLVGLSTRPLATTFGDEEDPSFVSFQRFVDGP